MKHIHIFKHFRLQFALLPFLQERIDDMSPTIAEYPFAPGGKIRRSASGRHRRARRQYARHRTRSFQNSHFLPIGNPMKNGAKVIPDLSNRSCFHNIDITAHYA
jgi:hypothetical protein